MSGEKHEDQVLDLDMNLDDLMDDLPEDEVMEEEEEAQPKKTKASKSNASKNISAGITTVTSKNLKDFFKNEAPKMNKAQMYQAMARNFDLNTSEVVAALKEEGIEATYQTVRAALLSEGLHKTKQGVVGSTPRGAGSGTGTKSNASAKRIQELEEQVEKLTELVERVTGKKVVHHTSSTTTTHTEEEDVEEVDEGAEPEVDDTDED